jgi:tetratricopeptide (TPR) repeat protein
LNNTPEFVSSLERIFPKDLAQPEYLYGHALTLLEAKRYEELESFFDRGFLASSPPAAMESHYYHRAKVLQGQNIVALWEESNPNSPLTPDAKLEREEKLGEARDAFRGYLEKYPEDLGVSMLLGHVQERMEVYTAAYLTYAQIARETPYHAEAFRGVVRLHADALLPPKELDEAWSLLREYSGDKKDIIEYRKEVAQAILTGARLHCRGCGRKCSEGETTCLECGYQLEASSRNVEPKGK